MAHAAVDRVRRLSTAHGGRAVVTAATSLAANAAVALLARGGNVFDAAVGAALAETVLLPPKCGLAGDVVALILRAGQQAPTALISIGAAPADLAGRAVRKGLPTTGAWSVGMPGAPFGYSAISRLGTLGLGQQAEAAIAFAQDGFPWPEVAAALTVQARDTLIRENQDPIPYLPGGEPAAPGTIMCFPGLATLLEQFVERREGLFSGPAGEHIRDALRSRGRSIDSDDLTNATLETTPPAERRVRGRTIWATPAPTYGEWLLETMSHWAPEDGAKGLYDTVERSAARRKDVLYDGRGSGTSVVTAADAAGNAIVLVHSNSYQRYGSGIVVAPYGLILSNRAGRGFSSDPSHPNFCVQGRRPATTLHAWAVGRGDGTGVGLMGATPGGENQMRWNAQVLADVLEGDEDPGSLVTRPRWGKFDKTVRIESSHSLAKVELYEGDTQQLSVPDYSLKSAMQVLAFGPSLRAAADPRTEASSRSW